MNRWIAMCSRIGLPPDCRGTSWSGLAMISKARFRVSSLIESCGRFFNIVRSTASRAIGG